MSDTQFPIHCKCKSDRWYYKIISKTEALTVRHDEQQQNFVIDHKDYVECVTHEAYDGYMKGEYEDITPEEFFKVFTETNNHLIRTSR